MQRVAPGEHATAIGCADGVEVNERTKQEDLRVSKTEEMGETLLESSDMIDGRGQEDRERHHENGQQTVGDAVGPLGGQDSRQKHALDGAKECDDAEPVERDVRHWGEIIPFLWSHASRAFGVARDTRRRTMTRAFRPRTSGEVDTSPPYHAL